MPIFEYRCQDCGTRFEKLVRGSTERDGLAFIAAILFGVAATALYVLAVRVIVHYGAHGLHEAKEIIKGWIF